MANQYVVTLVKGKLQVYPIGSMKAPEKEFPTTTQGWQDLETWMESKNALSFRASAEVLEWLVENDI